MKKNPKNEIRQIAKFLDIPLSEERLEDIAKETTFEAMAKNPSTNYEHWDKIGLRDPKESKFMRKGIQTHFRNKRFMLQNLPYIWNMKTHSSFVFVLHFVLYHLFHYLINVLVYIY